MPAKEFEHFLTRFARQVVDATDSLPCITDQVIRGCVFLSAILQKKLTLCK